MSEPTKNNIEISFSGSKYYHLNDKLHRLHGPAIDRWDGYQFWYYKGKFIHCESQKEFEKLLKLRVLW